MSLFVERVGMKYSNVSIVRMNNKEKEKNSEDVKCKI